MIRFGNVTIDRKKRIITNGKRSLHWVHGARIVEFRLLQALLLSGGLTKKQLFDLLYGWDPEGGPLHGVNIVSVMMVRLHKKMRHLNVELRKSRHNSYTVYRAIANA